MSAETAQGLALQRFFRHHFGAPSAAERVLSIRAHTPDALDRFQPEQVICLQTNRLRADALERRGFRIVGEAAGPFDLCLIEATKHKDENLHHLALGWSLLRPGGHLIVSAANALGGESLAKRIAAAMPLQGVWSLAKCRVLWLPRGTQEAMPETVGAWLALGDYRPMPDTGLYTCPGIFSAGSLDAGTRLLCESLPYPLAGHGADFGAGYGAISRSILMQSEQVRRLDLYDIERKALKAAELNLAPWRDRCEIACHWADVTRGVAGHRFDWIVMNPPFHTGRAAVPALGRAFIETAAAHLKPQGTLWLVANRHLPYESVLSEHYSEVATVLEQQGFKVCRARHPRMTRR